jgi:chromosome segregation ATPase
MRSLRLLIAVVSLSGTIYTIRSSRAKQQADTSAQHAQTAFTLAQAAEMLGPIWKRELEEMGKDLNAAIGEIEKFNQRMNQVLEDKKRLEARAAMLDEKAADLSEGRTHAHTSRHQKSSGGDVILHVIESVTPMGIAMPLAFNRVSACSRSS